MVFCHAIGDQMIHLLAEKDDHPVYCHAFCVANMAEAYEESILGCSWIPDEEAPAFFVESHQNRHLQCKDPDGRKPRPRNYLALLTVSRQVYYEANHVFWTTNTFSFDSAYCLEWFMESLNYAQKNKLAKIHLEMRTEYMSFRRWSQAIPPRLLPVLRGLKSIDVSVDIEVVKRDWENEGPPILKPLLRFQKLALERVRFIVGDRQTLFSNPGSWPFPFIHRHAAKNFQWSRFTWLEKREIACEYEVRLLTGLEGKELKSEVARKLDLERQQWWQRRTLSNGKDQRGLNQDAKEESKAGNRDVIDLMDDDWMAEEDEVETEDVNENEDNTQSFTEGVQDGNGTPSGYVFTEEDGTEHQ